MPRLSNALPKYRKHRASGQAVVTLNGRDFYLGPYGTKTSKYAYDALVGEWLAGGRRLVDENTSLEVTVSEVCVDFASYAKTYYQKNGKTTTAFSTVKKVMRDLRRLYGDSLATEFGPVRLKALRQTFIDSGLTRKTVNDYTKVVIRAFRLAVENQKLSPLVCQSLETLATLKKNHTEAKEGTGVKTIDLAIVTTTLPHMLKTPADMVRVQLLTGCRPQDVCNLRPVDVDQNGEVWQYYCPVDHETSDLDKERIIFIGPQAQAVLRPYMNRKPDEYCFSPKEAVEQQLREKRLSRKTPRYGNRKYAGKASTVGNQYTTASYRRAIHRACDKAFPVPTDIQKDVQKAELWRSDNRWSPNQLRHTKGTQIRKEFGLEAAQVILGHSRADVTQIYAETDRERGIQVAKQVG